MVHKLLPSLGLLAALIVPSGALFAQAPPPVPALPDTERRTQYSVSASTCACSVGFQLYGSGTDVDQWIEVWVAGARYLSTDVSHGWALSSATGTLATIPRPITNAVLTFNAVQTGTVQIVGAERPRRLSQFQNNQGVTARDLNQAISDLYAVERELWDKTNDVTGRAVIGRPGETMTQLPAAVTRANGFLFFDSGGNPGVASGIAPGAPITNPNLAPMPANTVKCNNTGGSATPIDCTAAQANTLTNTSDNLFRSGRPWCDVRAQGAVGDGSTDDTVAIQACIALVQAFNSGGTVYLSPSAGHYCAKTGLSVTGAVPVSIIGGGPTVVLDACNTDVAVLTLNSAKSTLYNFWILGKGTNNDATTFGATQDALVIGSSCTSCLIKQVTVWGGRRAISSTAGEFVMEEVDASISYGPALVYTRGGAWMLRDKFDQQWPQVQPTGPLTIAAWTNAHAYNLGDVVSLTCAASGVTCPSGVTAYYLQVTQAGTSAGSAPTLKNYGITVVDNTVRWLLAAPTTYAGIGVDTSASEIQMIQTDITGPFSPGLLISNSLAGTAPSSVIVTDSVIGQNYSGSIAATAGNNLTLKGTRVGGCLASGCGSVNFSGAWTGDATIVNNTFLGGPLGLVLGAGKNYTVTGNNFFGTTTGAILVAAGIGDFVITGNVMGSSSTFGSNANAVTVSVGASDHYNITNNIVHGSTTGVVDNGTGVNKTISGNNN